MCWFISQSFLHISMLYVGFVCALNSCTEGSAGSVASPCHRLNICSMDFATETVTSFCVSCILGHIWKEKASGSVARIVFPIRPSLSHGARAPSCVSCVPWLAVRLLVPVVCVPAAGSSPERLSYPPWTAC